MDLAAEGFDGLTYFVYRPLPDQRIGNAEDVSRKIKGAFVEFPNWRNSENALHELQKQVTFAILTRGWCGCSTHALEMGVLFVQWNPEFQRGAAGV